jgi:hypothetical protein
VLRDHHALAFLLATRTQTAPLAIPVRLRDKEPDSGVSDPSNPTTFYEFTHSGLYSFEVSALGIIQAGVLLGTDSDHGFEFGDYSERSIILDDSVFYIRQGEVLSSHWNTPLEK